MQIPFQIEACTKLLASCIELPASLCSIPTIPDTPATPYKGVPGMIFWPMGMRLSHPIRAVQLYPTPINIFTDQSGSILTNKTVPFRSIKLWRFRFFICMKMNPSGTRRGGFYLYKSASLWLGEHFPFSLKTAFPQLELKHLWRCLSHSSKVEWTGSEQVEQSCLASKGGPQGPPRSHAAS